eukprot:TRINITY_DN7807_c0_g1_i1.p1 TRINITY_DN7807_c0_g1~~TRINITY_DN7807_c0_g1_i1.p1  ORF type:complete len:286 (+),score=43.44 TRINITY_DN7807_c0_g1_i1:71-928(+)
MKGELRFGVGSYNILNTSDYNVRQNFLEKSCGEVRGKIDLIGLQEVNYLMHQDDEMTRLLSDAQKQLRFIRGPVPKPFAHPYHKDFRIDGNGALYNTNMFSLQGISVKTLRYNRSAVRVLLKCKAPARVPASKRKNISFTSVHLHHEQHDSDMRREQLKSLLQWLEHLDAEQQVVASFLVGDFNEVPGQGVYNDMLEHKFKSAYLEANGKEPAVTWGDGFQSNVFNGPAEHSRCLDYIWLKSTPDIKLRVEEAKLFGNHGAESGSDHFGIAATIKIVLAEDRAKL